MNKGNTLISIVIPVAKEGSGLYKRIYCFIDKLRRALAAYGIEFEIILVSDVIHKDTVKAMIKLTRRDKRIRAFFLTRRIGKGGSIKNIIPFTRGKYVVLLDADIPITPIALLLFLFKAIHNGAELVIAKRVYRTHNLGRRILSIAYNTLVNMLFKTHISDHQAGFKLLSRRAAFLLLYELSRSDTFGYDTEIIVWARKLGIKYVSVDVAWIEKREESTIPPLRTLLTMFADLIILRIISINSAYRLLHKIPVGSIICLNSIRRVGREYITVIASTGIKRRLLRFLRLLYIGTAFRRR